MKKKYFLALFLLCFAPFIPLMAQKEFDLQGHRGARGLLPENTIPAFLEALRLGVTTLEMDVVVSKDRQIVVSHEPFFNHEISLTPRGETIAASDEKKHNLYQMNYAEIRRYDVGQRPNSRFKQQKKMSVGKPLLSEVIDSVEQYLANNPEAKPVFYNIETKITPAGDGIFHPKPDTFVSLLMDLIIQKKIANRVAIQSFDVRTLQIIHRTHPEIKLVLLVENQDGLDKNLARLGFLPAVYSPFYLFVEEALIKKCHEKGILIIPWTVNEAQKMSDLKKMGVDGLITDYPDIAVKTLR